MSLGFYRREPRGVLLLRDRVAEGAMYNVLMGLTRRDAVTDRVRRRLPPQFVYLAAQAQLSTFRFNHTSFHPHYVTPLRTALTCRSHIPII